MTRFPSNPDVIVVGAGTAGLAAANTLRQGGLDVLVLEAASRRGGRCYSDPTLFDSPFDVGGSWLHSAAINPLARLAEEKAARLHKAPWTPSWVTDDTKPLSDAEVTAYDIYQKSMWAAINRAGTGADDRPVAAALPDSPFQGTAQHLVAQMQGGDADVTSVQDVARYEDAPGDWLVEGGLGAFVASLFVDIPVKLDCPVREIDTSGTKVRATTPKGTVTADQLIITVSTGVLRAETITFTPPLPDRKVSALQQLPNGLLNKIGLDFQPEWQAAHQGQMADYRVGNDQFCALLFGFYDTNMAVGFVAGRFADLLETEGKGAATAFCLEALRAIFGNDVTKYIRRTTETAWRGNAHAFGSYSYALPGGADARPILAEAIDNRLFFAGEATVPSAYATVHGAYISGIKVGQQVLAQRGHQAQT